jgi:hypothetical protein
MPDKLTWKDFTENLNTPFQLTPEGGTALEAELVEVKPGRSTPRQEQFSLLFRAAQDVPLQQGMFRLEHDKIGAFNLFLVPVRKDEQGFCYEAVFNRLLE